MTTNLLEINNLGLCLSERWLFRNLTLSIPRSSFIAITGPSGVGKTSLLRILASQLVSTEGKVDSNLGDDHLISMIFQDLQLTNGASTVRNVLAGCLGRHSALKTLFGFPRHEKELSKQWLGRFGLEKKNSQWASTLSRGERQRLAICRSMLSSPTLLLADEPVASLDSDWANRTLELLKNTQKEKNGSIICSLHDEDQVLKFADFVLRLDPDNPTEWSWAQINSLKV